MRELKTFEIDGAQYKVRHLSTTQALRVMHIFSRVIAPAIDPEARLQYQGFDLEKIVNALSPEDLDLVVKLLAESTTVVEPEKPLMKLSSIFDDHFAGAKLLTMTKWLVAAVKFNFSDFLGGISNLAPEGAGEESPSTD